MVNPVQTALGCPLRTEALAYPINGAVRGDRAGPDSAGLSLGLARGIATQMDGRSGVAASGRLFAVRVR